MILGVGTDLIDIRRIERTLERFGDRFVDRVFTAAERARAERRFDRAAAYAKRYAAKEACAKALGTGFRQGVYWRDIGVDNRPSGQPLLRLTGGAAARLAALTPTGMTARIDVSLTDEPPFGARGRDHQRGRGGAGERGRDGDQMTGRSLYVRRRVGYCPSMRDLLSIARQLLDHALGMAPAAGGCNLLVHESWP